VSYQLLINGDDRTPDAEWDATWEERVDGVGMANVTIQDRTNDPAVIYGLKRDVIQMLVDGVTVFHGEITRSRVDLPPGRPWRRWKITASDFNSILDLRLVGAADGYSWGTIDGGQTYRAIDPEASGFHSDRSTFQHLFTHYVRKPIGAGGGEFQISTFVFNYIPARLMYDRATNTSHLFWTNTTVRSAIDEMRSLAGFPIYYWIDPTDHAHWVAFGDPLLLTGGGSIWPKRAHVFYAPADISDTPGSGEIGGRDLFVEFDATYMPEQCYVVGVTDFIHNGGTTKFQGTGWELRHSADLRKRHTLVDAQAKSEAQKNAVAAHNIRYSQRARIKGSVTIGSPTEAVDVWRCGQMVKITDARLPSSVNGKLWPILRVAGSLKSGNDFRVYTLEFGDAPIGRFSAKYRTSPQRLPTARLPANRHRIFMPNTHLRPSSSYTVESQMIDHSGKAVRQGGVAVAWSLVTRDSAGAVVSAGSIAALDDFTDRHGQTAATLTTGSTTGLHYHLTCKTVAQ
jgi:hypothetical protein